MVTRSLSSILDELAAGNASEKVFSLEELKKFVSEASAQHHNAGPGTTTLLYSGIAPTGLPAWKVAQDSLGSSQVLTLTEGSVDVATLLGDAEFTAALERHVATAGSLDPVLDKVEIDARVKLILDGTQSNGVRVPNGLWDDASRRFAENAVGEVMNHPGFRGDQLV